MFEILADVIGPGGGGSRILEESDDGQIVAYVVAMVIVVIVIVGVSVWLVMRRGKASGTTETSKDSDETRGRSKV